MKILIIGSGGREHALAWKIAQSKMVSIVYVAPGNGGTQLSEKCINVSIQASQHSQLLALSLKEGVGLVVVGPEAPLAGGLVNLLKDAGLRVFGPTQASAQLEASKVFAKKLMRKCEVPTAFWEYTTKTTLPEWATRIIDRMGPDCVVKEDGLAGGKGVYVCSSREEILQAFVAVQCHRVNEDPNSSYVLIEKRLEGPELSYIVIADGKTFLPLPPSRDYKRLRCKDRGPNTGGMGAVAPVALPDSLRQKIHHKIITPILKGLAEETGERFCGFLYVGLMLTEQGPKVLEFNVRGGDPETEAIMLSMFESDDLVPYLLAASEGLLSHVLKERLDLGKPPYLLGQHTCCVVMANETYPRKASTLPEVVSGIDEADALEGVKVFHGGTKREPPAFKVKVAGGRVLAVTAQGGSPEEACQRAYQGVSKIHFKGAQYRCDIGSREDFSEDPGASVDK